MQKRIIPSDALQPPSPQDATSKQGPSIRNADAGTRRNATRMRFDPLVSILIPAYNAERWIADTLRSALAQTWPRIEIIVVDDGSTDRTAAIARTFESDAVKVVVKPNGGAAAARNHALDLSRGDYIQWLDADDLLSPTKIESQLRAVGEPLDPRLLLSGPWAYFSFRPERARFEPDPLWADLTPVEWLLRKMGSALHMQTATWLTSRELAQAAGRWDERLLSDDDGEYFCRVLLASRGTKFVPEARVYYRNVPGGRLSFVGTSERKMEALLLSMRLHLDYLRSLEDSPRVRAACFRYLAGWHGVFDPASASMRKLEAMASDLGPLPEDISIRRKYRWLLPLIGRRGVWRTQVLLPQVKARVLSRCDQIASMTQRAS